MNLNPTTTSMVNDYVPVLFNQGFTREQIFTPSRSAANDLSNLNVQYWDGDGYEIPFTGHTDSDWYTMRIDFRIPRSLALIWTTYKRGGSRNILNYAHYFITTEDAQTFDERWVDGTAPNQHAVTSISMLNPEPDLQRWCHDPLPCVPYAERDNYRGRYLWMAIKYTGNPDDLKLRGFYIRVYVEETTTCDVSEYESCMGDNVAII